MGALSFTSPLILIALGALPLIWLLLRATPPSPKRENFPAFIILRQLKTAEETPDRTPWWLLLMRLLLAALIILALAGPVLNAPSPGVQTGPMLVVIDDSWTAAQHWRTRRDALRDSILSAVERFAPDIRSHIESEWLVTAADLAQTNGAPRGAYAAREVVYRQLARAVSVTSAGMIGGLYFCGPEAQIGYGVNGAAGRNAALAALKKTVRAAA